MDIAGHTLHFTLSINARLKIDHGASMFGLMASKVLQRLSITKCLWKREQCYE